MHSREFIAPMGLEIGAISPEEIAISRGGGDDRDAADPEGNWRTLSKSIFADEHLGQHKRRQRRSAAQPGPEGRPFVRVSRSRDLPAEVSASAIILAAGESRRMGRPKALLPFRRRDISFGDWPKPSATMLAPVIAVFGFEAER